MRHSAALLFASAVAPLLAVVSAQENCNYTTSCGSTYPCCSDFGFCGTDHCRGGCNPMWSFSPTSCDRLPLCESKTYTFADTSRIINATLFDGNVSKVDWTIDNAKMELPQHLGVNNGELGLFLTQENGGTRISSTRYMHYGRVTATMKVGHWKGVVVTMIGMSDAHDEIDWEWPGEKSAMEGQSNYFWLGVVDPKGGYHTPDGFTDGFSNFHDYAFDWSPDKLDWLIDGNVVRTVTKQETLDQNTGTYHYPTTPIRIQISIWPAGIAGVSQGVQEWAGGMIDWSDPEYVAAGHFYTIIKQVTVQCNIAGDLAPPPDALSYVYGTNVSGIPSIAYSNESAISGSPAFVSVAHSLLPLAAAGVLGLAALLF